MKTTLQILISIMVVLVIIQCTPNNCSGFGFPSYERAELGDLAYRTAIPLWSRDGSQIIFARPGEAVGKQAAGVYVVQSDGSRIWHLESTGTPSNYSPALSPDGSRVAFAMVKRLNFSSKIVTTALDGSDLKVLTRNDAIDANPSWSPDGTEIVFCSDRSAFSDNPTSGLYIMDSDGSDVRSLADGVASSRYPAIWSPNGDHITFVVFQSGIKDSMTYDDGYSVYTVRPDGTDLKELGDSASVPAWSPDGTRLAFIKEGEDTRELQIMDTDGSNVRTLWSFERNRRLRLWYNNLAWSPDGSEILYGRLGFGHVVLVVVVGVDGSGARDLSNSNSMLAAGGAAWSPDGSRIAFHSISDHSDIVLYTTARDGSDERVLVKGHHLRLVAANSDWRDVTDDLGKCSESGVVSDPGKNPNLVRDCKTLLGVRDTLAGDAILNWSAEVPFSDWMGVVVKGSPRRVVGLGLVGQFPIVLSGVIPPELGNLTDLEWISLHSSRLSGSIPPELGNLTKLRKLDLSVNWLTGTIPPELGRLSNLEELTLSRNGLEGGIPPEIGNLTKLEELRLLRTGLEGDIPEELGNLSNLKTLDIRDNKLTGCVPAELFNHLGALRGRADDLEYCGGAR